MSGSARQGTVAVGVDLGGSGCKVTALDEGCRVVAAERRGYRTFRPHAGWVEQDPADWVRAAEDACRSVVGRVGRERVRALSVTGATHNAVLLGAGKQPVRPCITLLDQRASEQAERLAREWGPELLRRCRNWPRAGWTLPQLMWLAENEPESLRRAQRIVFMKDYVRSAFTGDFVTDCIDAEGSLLLDVGNGNWDASLCDLAQIVPEMLPAVVGPTDVVGNVSSRGSSWSGLLRHTAVVAGCSDTAAEALACGANHNCAGVVKIATVGNLNIIKRLPTPSASYFTYTHVLSPLSYCSFGTSNAGGALAWLGQVLGIGDLTAPGELDSILASTAPGANGILFQPYLAGARAPVFDPFLRGSFLGLSEQHTRADLIRSSAEGVALSIADCAEAGKSLGLVADDHRLVGGGSQSLGWAQIVADTIGAELTIPVLGEASAGGALLALIGGGQVSLEEVVEVASRRSQTVMPRSAEHALYVERLALYREARDRVASVARLLQGQAKSAAEISRGTWSVGD